MKGPSSFFLNSRDACNSTTALILSIVKLSHNVKGGAITHDISCIVYGLDQNQKRIPTNFWLLFYYKRLNLTHF